MIFDTGVCSVGTPGSFPSVLGPVYTRSDPQSIARNAYYRGRGSRKHRTLTLHFIRNAFWCNKWPGNSRIFAGNLINHDIFGLRRIP